MGLTDDKQGFRIRIDKRRGTSRIELLRDGWFCRRVDRGPVTLIVVGDIVGERGLVAPHALLEDWTRHGTKCLDRLDGAFLLVFLDAESSDVLVCTDRVNGLKGFVEDTPDRIDLVSSLCFLERRPRRLDPISVVSYLCNGFVFNGRTIFEGVRVLPRAAIHRISAAQGVASSGYWTVQLDRAYEHRPEADLHEELASVINEAIRRRTSPTEDIYLSLSGGYDSTCILGSLLELGRTGVRAFSYADLPAPGIEGTDASVAAISAKAAGIAHTRVFSFDGDPLSVLRANVELGECRANLCLEWDAWQRMHGQIPRDALFVVGDEWVGDGCGGLDIERDQAPPEDILAAAFIRPSACLQPFAPLFALTAEAAAFDEELLLLMRDFAYPGGTDQRSLLYLNLRIACTFTPWRELFAGRWHRVIDPLLDRHILEFTSHLAPSQRVERNLFKRMAAQRYPHLFAVPRASRWDPLPWPSAIQAYRPVFEAELRSPSPLDESMPPASILALADATVTGPMAVRRKGPLPPWLVFLRAFALRDFARQHALAADAPHAAAAIERAG